MSLPTFNGFSLQDGNFIAERITFKGLASRDVIRGKINRREGVKLLSTSYGEKAVTIDGNLIAASASDLQTKLDNLKAAATMNEGDLIIETGRTWKATVMDMAIPDEHYNQSKAPFSITFMCSNPFALGTQLSVTIPVASGAFTLSGRLTISGTFYNRPIVTYNPPNKTGNTFIKRLDLYHVESGQTVSVSGFNSGAAGGLLYQSSVTVNLDDFTTFDGSTALDNTGAFPKLEPGVNNFTLTADRAFSGGSVSIVYSPRYL